MSDHQEKRNAANRAALTPEARKAFDALSHEAEMLVTLARWAIDPEEADGPEYHAQRVLDYAHGCVDLAREFKRALAGTAAGTAP